MLHSYRAVVITGGSSGIGKSFLEHAAKLSPNLVFFNISRRVPDIKIEGLRLFHFPCDLADPRKVARVGNDVIAALDREAPSGRVMLVNNSGYGSYGPFAKARVGRELSMLDVNLRAPVQLTGILLPRLQAQGGAVINMASTAAFQPTSYMAVYGASKVALLHWSLALGEELRGTGVRVLAVCPGPTATEFFRAAGLRHPIIPDALGQTPAEVVEAALRALAAGRQLVVCGWKNKTAAALVSKLPKPLATRFAARAIAHYRGAEGWPQP